MRNKNSRYYRGMRSLKTTRESQGFEKCPYCGKRLRIGKAAEVGSRYEDNDILICEGFPECDSYGRIRFCPDGTYKTVSTPADKKLRLLRHEVHYYMDQLVENRICTTDDEAHKMATMNSVFWHTGMPHVGDMREYACREAIENMIRILYMNRERLVSYYDWHDHVEETLYLSEEVQMMKRSLSEMFQC